jgi:glutathione synthase
MRVCFLVNNRREPSVEQTTTLLIGAALRRNHQVRVCGVGDLGMGDDGKVFAKASAPQSSDPTALVEELSVLEGSRCLLDEQDLCIVRTNPGRDEARRALHLSALRLLERVGDRGARVINSPRGLFRALTKLSLMDLPADLRPRTLVTHDPDAIEEFLHNEPAPVVIKPLEGTRGRDVFVLDRKHARANVRQIIDVILRQGYAMVQEFVPGAEQGDVRVTVIDGKVLELDGHAAAVARVPSQKDFRSNLHAGGTARAVEVSAAMRDAVARIAPQLRSEGLVHVGVDFVGGRILELNVFSPGGLYPSERLYGKDFSAAVIEAFERLT